MLRASYHEFALPAILLMLLLPLASRLTHGKEKAAVKAPAATIAQASGSPAEAATTTITEPASAPTEDKVTRMLGGGPENVTLTPEEQQFFDLVNTERKARGVPEVTVAPLLVRTAREKSQEMHDLNYWGHQPPNTQKGTAMWRVVAALKETPLDMLVGENLYYCSSVQVASGHAALMNSPTHRKNILNPRYQYLGVGAYIAQGGRFWVTEHFLDIQY